ncbi:MAG: glycosyltransferase, partial [archaeon]
MRIAFFTDSFWPQINGVTTSIWNTCETLATQGHHFIIFAPKPSPFPANPPHHPHIQLVWLPSKPLPTYTDYLIAYSFSKDAQKAFDDFGAELVHIHTPFYVAKKGIELARKSKIPVIGTFHTVLSEFLQYIPIPTIQHNPIMKELTWKYIQYFYGKCDLVTTPTEILAKELRSHGFQNVHVMSNAIDYELFSKAKVKKAPKKITMIYYGRISFEKRIDVAIQTLFLVRKKHPNVELTVLGSGPAEASLKEQAKEYGIAPFVHFPGPFHGNALARRVKSHDILFAPSPMETQGLYVLEGMAAGLCVVGCNSRAIPIAVGKNERGLLFENGNAEDAAEKVNQLIQNPTKRKK